MSGCADRFAYRRNVRREDGCTRLKGTISGRDGGKREDLQWAQVLVPIRNVSLNRNVCGLRRCLGVGYCDEEFPVQETIFLGTWDINGAKY